MSAALVEEITRYIQHPTDAETFNHLAVAAWRWQCERVDAVRSLAEHHGLDPATVSDWRQIPPLPTLAYKHGEISAAPAERTFLSSGTTSEARSRHLHAHLDLYRTVIEATFPPACLPAPPPVAMLSLIPGPDLLPESSLSFMAGHVVAAFGGPESVWAVGRRGVQVATARTWLGAAQRRGEPVVILSTTLALDQLLTALERRALHFRLPAGSVLFETGGGKGRESSVDRRELHRRVGTWLGIPIDRIVEEYGMTELTSHFYAGALTVSDRQAFLPPPWTRVRIVDPDDLQERPPGEPGLIAVLDLANLSSSVHLLTEDLGRGEGEGFVLLGRAPGAQLRGCSLTAEELQHR